MSVATTAIMHLCFWLILLSYPSKPFLQLLPEGKNKGGDNVSDAQLCNLRQGHEFIPSLLVEPDVGLNLFHAAHYIAGDSIGQGEYIRTTLEQMGQNGYMPVRFRVYNDKTMENAKRIQTSVVFKTAEFSDADEREKVLNESVRLAYGKLSERDAFWIGRHAESINTKQRLVRLKGNLSLRDTRELLVKLRMFFLELGREDLPQ